LRNLVAVALLGALACVESQQPVGPPPGRLGLAVVAVGLVSPVLVTAPPGDSNRVFVVERNGRIRSVRDDTLLTRSFLDLMGDVRFADEQGLLALAFHPDYATNGRFYVHFSNVAGDTRVVRYHVTAHWSLVIRSSSIHPLPFFLSSFNTVPRALSS
jgi:glucose/arabinose dehydrogenase